MKKQWHFTAIWFSRSILACLVCLLWVWHKPRACCRIAGCARAYWSGSSYHSIIVTPVEWYDNCQADDWSQRGTDHICYHRGCVTQIPGTVTCYTPELPNIVVLALCSGVDGRCWVTTANNSLYISFLSIDLKTDVSAASCDVRSTVKWIVAVRIAFWVTRVARVDGRSTRDDGCREDKQNCELRHLIDRVDLEAWWVE